MQYYDILEVAGSGSYGKVYKALCKRTNQVVAIKHITDFGHQDYQMVKVIREIQILKGL